MDLIPVTSTISALTFIRRAESLEFLTIFVRNRACFLYLMKILSTHSQYKYYKHSGKINNVYILDTTHWWPTCVHVFGQLTSKPNSTPGEFLRIPDWPKMFMFWWPVKHVYQSIGLWTAAGPTLLGDLSFSDEYFFTSLSILNWAQAEFLKLHL